MDLLGGYQSSSSDDDNEGGGMERKQRISSAPAAAAAATTPELVPPPPPPTPTPALLPVLRRPPPGAIHAAPRPSVPLAVLRNQGLMMTTTNSNSHSLVISNNNGAQLQLLGPMQGPSSLHDPSDKTSIYLRAMNSKTGSTSIIEANAAVDEYSFSKNRNAFQRGERRKIGGAGAAAVGGGEEDEMAMAPGEIAREIQRNDYGHARHFAPNYGVVNNNTVEGDKEEGGEGKTEGDNLQAESAVGQQQLQQQQPEQQQAAMVVVGQKRTILDDYLYNDSVPQSRRARIQHFKKIEGPLLHSHDDELTHGIWAPPSTFERALASDSLSALESGVELHPRILAERAYLAERDRQRGLAENEDNEKEKFDRMVERKMSHLLPPRLEENDVAMEATTTFHGEESVDYRGRSWTVPPPGVKGVEDPTDMEDHTCYVPKKCVFRFMGHEKGVHRIRLFPKTGHLLLSAGLDGACKIWSLEQKKCMRTYIGHSAAVRDVQFNSDGSKFVSASFDRYLRLWDVESGKVLGTYTNRRVPYVVKFYPRDDNIFVVGCSDNKIVAYDSATGEITQEYDHHLAPVNTITFVEDNGMKMVTSSDDKKVLVWEWDIGVPIKYISDPTMHSMPVITMHPSEKFMVCQSLDNRIVVYQAGDRYSLQRKKKMEGHNVAGYACDIAISPDGRFVASGDGNGKLFFWDFKRTRMLQKYHAHDKGPAIGVAWHPVEPSTVFTCGWDGVIKMWQ